VIRALAGVLGLAVTVVAAEPVRFEYAQPHMGTIFRIVLYSSSEAGARGAADAAFARIEALDETLSDYRDSSETTRVSRAAGGPPVTVSEDFYRVLRASRAIASASGGAFDVTVGPLAVLWRSARRHSEVPGDEQIAAALAKVGDARMVLDERQRTVALRVPGMQLDFGGIAKGFAADAAVTVLARHGITSALVAAGGDIVVSGAPPGKEGWQVAVAGLGRDEAGSIVLRQQAVSTSGDAEQFFEVNGVRYSHILDPRTGRALTGRSSVSVVARNGTTSDSLATAVSVLGPDAGMRLVERTAGAAAKMIRDDGSGPRVYASARWVER